MEDSIIISAGPDLFPDLARLESACFAHPMTEERFHALSVAGGHVFLAALRENRVAGYAGLQYVLDEGYILNLAVWPQFRRRGVASALIEALEVEAVKLGLVFLTLEVREGNAPAIALYESAGFLLAGLRKNYYDSPGENALLLTKFL